MISLVLEIVVCGCQNKAIFVLKSLRTMPDKGFAPLAAPPSNLI